MLRKKSTAHVSDGDVIIPEKLYFRIGEASRLCKLPAYVLRFWETEFPQIKPIKSGTGQRMYRRRDLESILRIKTLLYKEGFTIPGARQQLRAEVRPGKTQPALPFPQRNERRQRLLNLRQEMKEVLGILSGRRN